ncbi:cupin-like domain-containing protein [Tumidithrix elongata RA019]|uniref:Cupin-like domain-containing protein n=1 Tax=Tumidithrix elongata BACA0141 TaxID=2716417 RepID=A0AAW9PVP8_9CYAN|nr:cupin-like domain-containing protein [Tumidithrix elongata RA019]
MSSLNSFSLEESIAEAGSNIPNPIIQGDALDFRKKFNDSPFMFSHNLAEHPLFELPRLAQLASTLIGKEESLVMCKAGDFPINQKWSDRPHKLEQVAEVIENIETSNSWLLLQSTQLDPEYKALMEQVIAEAETLTEIPLRKEITWLEAFIFIASPHTTTPYHMDSEQNFIFQIHGEKEDNLFDRRDRSVLTESEIERFYIGDRECLSYQAENQSKANVYHLTPGMGIYHPVNDPHWVKNGSTYTVSMTVIFYMRSYDLRARVYQVNHFLRRLGLNPTPPGKSAWIDGIKIHGIGLFSKRNPSTKDEAIRSGINRVFSIKNWILAPLKAYKKMIRRSK